MNLLGSSYSSTCSVVSSDFLHNGNLCQHYPFYSCNSPAAYTVLCKLHPLFCHYHIFVSIFFFSHLSSYHLSKYCLSAPPLLFLRLTFFFFLTCFFHLDLLILSTFFCFLLLFFEPSVVFLRS